MNILGNYGINIGLGTSALQHSTNPYLYNSTKDVFEVSTSNKTVKKLCSNSVSSPFIELYSPKQLIKAYSNENFIKSLIAKSPNIQNILSANGLEANVYPENILQIINTHLTTTSAYALQIANEMNLSQADKQVLEQACVFHDFGKILIPKEIVNKSGELSKSERKIMKLHAELGAELLKEIGMNERVVNLVKNHHMPHTANNDMLGDILSVADIYSALREQRSYKKPLSEKEAIKILDQKAENGEVSTEVVNTLKSLLVKSNAA